MEVSYKKLWKILIDKDMKKKDLQAAAGSVAQLQLKVIGILQFCIYILCTCLYCRAEAVEGE